MLSRPVQQPGSAGRPAERARPETVRQRLPQGLPRTPALARRTEAGSASGEAEGMAVRGSAAQGAAQRSVVWM